MNDFKFVEPWNKTTEEDNGLLEQLRKELSEGHILFGKNLELVARRFDQDDILVKIVDENTYALVHLTWGEPLSANPHLPETFVYNSIEEAVKEK